MTLKARIDYLKNDLTSAQFSLLIALATHPNGLTSNELLMLEGIDYRCEDINSKVKALLRTEELEIHVTSVVDKGSCCWLWELRDTGGEL